MVQLSHLALPLRSKNHSPVEGRKTPMYDLPVPVQSPATGRSPAIPNEPRQLSTLQPSHLPLPLRSRNHSPVEGRKTPMYDLLVAVQSPATGRSPAIPNEPRQLSTLQPSQIRLPFVSENHAPVLGRKIPIDAGFGPTRVGLTRVILVRLTAEFRLNL